MKKYLNIIKSQLLQSMQYRFNITTRIFTYIIDVLIIYFMWLGVFYSSSADEISGYTKNDILVYVLIVGFMHYIFNFNNISRLSSLIHSGKLSLLLIKPFNIILENFFFYLGSKIIILFIFSISILLLGLFGIIYNFLLVLILFIAYIIMYFFLTLAISSLGFWIYQTWPLKGLFNGIYYILSGALFPLDLLPNNIFKIIKYNPFSIVGFALTRSIQSKLNIEQLFYYISAAFVWCIILYILSKILIIKGLKKYEGMGA